jgi:hypothetical protein
MTAASAQIKKTASKQSVNAQAKKLAAKYPVLEGVTVVPKGRDKGTGFLFTEKHEKVVPGRIYRCFDLRTGKGYDIPSEYVGPYLTADHAKWKVTPGRHGQKHADSDLRVLPIDERLDRFLLPSPGKVRA